MTTLLAVPDTDITSQTKAERAASPASLAEAFHQVCARFGDRIAISCGSEQITYAALHKAATRIAASLQTLPLKPDSLVAIYLDRSIDMVASMLGVILAGAAYLPIDPTYPEARVRETLADAAPIAVITGRTRAGAIDPQNVETLFVADLMSHPVCDHSVAHPTRTPKPEDLAYVIYTSGSTGKPKGVMVTHHNVLRLLEQTQAWFHFNEHDVWTMFHSFAFDFSVWEMWGPLLSGGRLVLVPFEISRSPEDFYALLCAERVTVLNQTPTAFSMLIHAETFVPLQAIALRLVILGGEALNLRSLLPWFARHGDAKPEIVNMYGITETTVHVTYRRIRTQDAERETDSIIGEPIPDLTIHLLDDSLTPVADGEIGEMCIGGAGVARGYLNRPELSAERFVDDPLATNDARMYRSGDLARRRADGELVYLGRADRQVKINGFRIELGEIEAVLASCPGVSQTCVTTHTDPAAGTRLVAYVVAPSMLDLKTARLYAEQHLPVQMRPAFYVSLSSLPMNVNGKVDRDALPLAEFSSKELVPPQVHRGPHSPDIVAMIAGVWSHVLQTATINKDDNFFDVGGTSLLLVTLRSQLQEMLNRNIPITWLFEHPSIRSLAARMDREAAQAAPSNNGSQEKAAQQRASFTRSRTQRSVSR